MDVCALVPTVVDAFLGTVRTVMSLGHCSSFPKIFVHHAQVMSKAILLHLYEVKICDQAMQFVPICQNE
jgi:hypothetical protein